MNLAWLLWLASLLPQDVADQTCLAATVYLEARGESKIGQLAVAEVAARRRETGRWGDNICSVVTARGQFATATTAPEYVLRDASAWQNAWAVAGKTLKTWSLPRAQRDVIVPDADHFVVTDTPAYWIDGPPVATIGAHAFYRLVN